VRAHYAREDTTWQLGIRLVHLDLWYLSWRDLRRSYPNHSILFWRHYQPFSSFFYVYSKSTPFCMRSVIMINKTQIWGICGYFLCYFLLHLIVYPLLLCSYQLCAAKLNTTFLVHLRRQIHKLFDKIPQPETHKTQHVPSKFVWELYIM
jgi:hypothetical protein